MQNMTFDSDWKAADLVKRIQKLLCNVDFEPFIPQGSEVWQIDSGNDWRLELLSKKEYRLSYRYKYSDKQWEALKEVVGMLGIGKFYT